MRRGFARAIGCRSSCRALLGRRLRVQESPTAAWNPRGEHDARGRCQALPASAEQPNSPGVQPRADESAAGAGRAASDGTRPEASGPPRCAGAPALAATPSAPLGLGPCRSDQSGCASGFWRRGELSGRWPAAAGALGCSGCSGECSGSRARESQAERKQRETGCAEAKAQGQAHTLAQCQKTHYQTKSTTGKPEARVLAAPATQLPHAEPSSRCFFSDLARSFHIDQALQIQV